MGDPIVTTRQGRVRGCEDDGVWAFRGVPYAQAPVGPLRFRPPAPAPAHRGVLDATAFGPIAPQTQSGLGAYFPGDPVAQDEDCLVANVWTPALAPARLPVMVYVHGGAYLNGSGSGALYRGAALARRGVVVVTFNYRLGVLGFLAHPALFDGASGGFGNWGLLDQVALLAWVRENVAAFGGDPSNVTIFGESAGAMSIAELLAAAPAQGLCRRAVLESGAPSTAYPDAAAPVAERIAVALGLRSLERDRLAGVPVAELLAVQEAVVAQIDDGFGMPLRPVVDGGLIAEHPARAIARGAARGVDLLVGTNRDEFKFFSFSASGLGDLDEARVAEIVGRYLSQAGLGPSRLDPAAVVAHYRSARLARGEPAGPRELLDAIAGDWIFRIPQLRLADAHRAHGGRVYAYLFTWESPFANGALGSCHALELPFVFGTLDNPLVGFFAGAGDDARALAETIQRAWVGFARTGEPATSPGMFWPAYEPGRRATMLLGRETQVADAPYEPERSFWEAPLGRYGVDGPIEGARPLGVALMAPGAGTDTGT